MLEPLRGTRAHVGSFLGEEAAANARGRQRQGGREPEQQDEEIAAHSPDGVTDAGRGVGEVGVLPPEVVSGDVGVAVRAAVVDHFLVQQEHELPPERLRFVGEVPVGMDVGSRERHRDVLHGDRGGEEREGARDGALALIAAPEFVVQSVEHVVRELLALLEEVAVIVDWELLDCLHAVRVQHVVHHRLPPLHGFFARSPERIGGLLLETGGELVRRGSGGEGARHIGSDPRPQDRRNDPDAHQCGKRRSGAGAEGRHPERHKDEDREVHEIEGDEPHGAQPGVGQALDAVRAHQERGTEQYAEDEQAGQAEGRDGFPQQERDRAHTGGQELTQRPGFALAGDRAVEQDEDQQGTEDLDDPCRVQLGDPLDLDGVLDGPERGGIAVVRFEPDGVPHVVGQTRVEHRQVEGRLERIAREVGRGMGVLQTLVVPDLAVRRDRGGAFPLHRRNGAPPGERRGQAERHHDAEHGDDAAIPPVLPELLQGNGADHVEPPAPDTPRMWAR